MAVYLVVFSLLWRRGVGRRPLLALPALRAAGLGLLHRVAAVASREPDREREPDPQGALPAAARAAVDGGYPARGVRRDARRRGRGQLRLPSGGSRHGLAVGAAGALVAALVAGAGARGCLAQRRLPGRRAPRQRRAAPAVVLPDADASYPLESVPGADDDPWLVDLIHWGNPITPAVDACARRSSPAAPAPRTSSTSPSPRSSRSRSARSSSGGWTTGSQSKSDRDPSVVQRVLGAAPGGQALRAQRPARAPATSDGQSSGMPRRGLRPGADHGASGGRPAARRPAVGDDRPARPPPSPPCGASSSRRDQSGPAGARRRRGARSLRFVRLSDERLLLRGERGAWSRVAAAVHAPTASAGRRCAAPRSTWRSSSSRAELREPERAPSTRSTASR